MRLGADSADMSFWLNALSICEHKRAKQSSLHYQQISHNGEIKKKISEIKISKKEISLKSLICRKSDWNVKGKIKNTMPSNAHILT